MLLSFPLKRLSPRSRVDRSIRREMQEIGRELIPEAKGSTSVAVNEHDLRVVIGGRTASFL